MNSRPATFIAGVLNGSLGLPVKPVAGFEEWFYFGEALGAVVGLAGDAAAIVAGLTSMGGGAALSVMGGGVLVPAGAPAIAGGAALTAGGAGMAGVHYDKLRDSLDHIFANEGTIGGPSVKTKARNCSVGNNVRTPDIHPKDFT